MTVSTDTGPGGGRPHRLFGFNLKTWHVVLSIMLALGSMFGSAMTAGAWVSNVVLDQQFSDRMDRFHEQAVPEIKQLIRAEVSAVVAEHEAEALREYNVDKLALAARLTGIEVHAAGSDQRLERIENMVWALYQSRFGNTPPPTSPGNGH